MNILIAPNNYYVMPGIVMLQSLFKNNKEHIDIYILQSDLTDENCNKLINFIKKNGGTPHIITIPDTLFQNAPVSIHITKEAYYRLLAQEILPDSIDRVLYLDLDLIVTGSLSSLYWQSFEYSNKEDYFVVCEGPGVSQKEWKTYDILHIPHEYRYFNSGVLLMNLKLLRETFDVNKIFNYIDENATKLTYHDQDTLNALFYDKVKYVDWHIYNQTILHIKNKHEAEQRLKDAVIIHYAGSDKPWNYDYKSWYFNLFWKYAKSVGYKKEYYQVLGKRFVWHVNNKLDKIKS